MRLMFWSILCFCPLVWGQGLLEHYIRKPEPVYRWERYARDRNNFSQVHYLHLISQTWRSAQEVDYPIWEHELKVTVPEFNFCRFINNRHRTALLVISGGNRRTPLSTQNESYIEALAVSLCMVVAELKQVPNQPLNFADEFNRPRSEDEILAYSLDQFLKTNDPEWPVHFAMTKSAVKAMDALQEFSQQHLDVNLEDFVVLGGSKRGWTTWLTAAVDARVRAILPVSIDMLNLAEQFRHHWETYGFYAPAVSEYEEFDLPCRVDTPRGRLLLDAIDPFAYRERFDTLPKFIINSAGDQFFVSDSSRFYYDDLPGPNWLRYTVNTDHAQGETDQVVELLLSARSWILDIVRDRQPPQFTWRIEPPNRIVVETQERPERVKLWQATHPEARDFRLETLGPAWTSTNLFSVGNGVYVAEVATPPRGFTAFLVELEYEADRITNANSRYSTGVHIVPDQLPFANLACRPPTERNDLWWNPQMGGQAVQIVRQNEDFAGAFYLYDASGQPFWVNFSNSSATQIALNQFTGPRFGGPWNENLVRSTSVGTGTWRWLSPTLAQFSYTLHGQPNQFHLVPFQRRPADALGGLWFDPQQSGQGVQLLHENQQLSGAWYVYDETGTATWYTFAGSIHQQRMTTPLLRFTGPPLGERWRENRLQGTPVGSVTLDWRDPTAITWQHQVEDVRGTLNLVRFRP